MQGSDAAFTSNTRGEQCKGRPGQMPCSSGIHPISQWFKRLFEGVVSLQGSDAAFTITYKRGIVQGNVGADTLSITDSPIVITNQTLGLTTASTLDFTRASCDGIFVRLLLISCILLDRHQSLLLNSVMHV